MVWCINTGAVLHFLPLHGSPLASVAFSKSSEWLVCASIDVVRWHWLTEPPVEHVLSMWLNDLKPVEDCVVLTRQLLAMYPHLPNCKVRLCKVSS